MGESTELPYRHKIIAENSPEHARIAEEESLSQSLDSRPLGSRLIKLTELQAPASVIVHELALIRPQLARIALDPSRTPFVQGLINDFIYEGMDESKPDSELEAFATEWGELIDQVDTLSGKMRDPKVVSGIVSSLIDDQLQQLIVFHNENFEKGQQEFAQQAPSWKAKFIKSTEAAIEAGQLPLSKEQLNDRMSKIQITLGDGLNPHRSTDLLGSFNSDKEIAVVFQQSLNFNLGEETLFHELMHALAGRVIYVANSEAHVMFGDYGRSGLGYYQSGTSDNGGFKWISEARTESLAAKLGQRNPRAYPTERALFNHLLTSGSTPLDERLFDEAYFENYDPGSPPAQRVPKWKAMYTAVNRSYAPGFLLKLDQYVHERGVADAGSQIQKDWKTIQQFNPRQKLQGNVNKGARRL